MDLDSDAVYVAVNIDAEKASPEARRSSGHLPSRSVSPDEYRSRGPSTGGSRGGYSSYQSSSYEPRGRGSYGGGPPRDYEPRGGYRGHSSGDRGGGYRGRGGYDRGKWQVFLLLFSYC